MSIVAFPVQKNARTRRGVTLFLHIRKTTLIAHQSAARPARPAKPVTSSAR